MGAAVALLLLTKPLCLPQILADISSWIIFFAGTPGEFTEDIAVQRSKFLLSKSVQDTGIKPKAKGSTVGGHVADALVLRLLQGVLEAGRS